MTLAPGESRYVSYRHQYDNQYTSSANAYFQSSDPSICTVSSSGEVVAKNPGTTYINVYSKISSVAPYCKITVKQVEPTSVSLPTSIEMTAGETRTLTPTVYPSNAQTSYSWYSSDSNIASVSSNGTITAKKHGSATISVQTSNGLRASCVVAVQKKKLNLTSSHTSSLVEKGTDIMLTADVSDANIYYTLDNSMPSRSSSLYNHPISINSSTCIKAIAIHPDYLDSDILELKYEVTSLQLERTLPNHGALDYPNHILPCFIFNSPIKQDSEFDKIQVLMNGQQVEFESIIETNRLYIIPTQDIENSNLSITLPERSISNYSNEPNENIFVSFGYTDPEFSQVLKWDSNSRLMENGDWYIWDMPSSFPNSSCRPKEFQSTPVLALKGIKDIYSNFIRYYYLTNDNTLMGWFRNTTYGNEYVLGDGTNNKHEDAVMIASDVKKYVGTEYNNGLIKIDNTLWLWGDNKSGQVGNGTTQRVLSPTQIISDVKDVLISDSHTLAIKKDNSVWGWGEGSVLGMSNNYIKEPLELTNLPLGIIELKTSDTHNIILTDAGEVFCFGKNNRGQLGIGSYSDYSHSQKVMENVIHVYIENNVSFALKENGDLYRWGEYHTTWNKVKSSHYPELIFTNVKNVFLNNLACNIVVLRNDNSVWCLGSNSEGLLGTGKADVFEYSPEFVKIFDDVENVWLNGNNIFVKRLDGSYWGLGYRLGIKGDHNGSSYVPVEVFNNTKNDIINISLPEQLIIEKGQRAILTVQINPINANHDDIIWVSNNPNIVSITDKGIITAHSTGDAVIDVSTSDYSNLYYSHCNVRVVEEGAGISEIINSLSDNEIFIYNIAGAIVYKGDLTSIPELSKGIYIIYSKEKTIKFIKH